MTRNPGIQESRNTEYGIRSTLKVPIVTLFNHPTHIRVNNCFNLKFECSCTSLCSITLGSIVGRMLSSRIIFVNVLLIHRKETYRDTGPRRPSSIARSSANSLPAWLMSATESPVRIIPASWSGKF